MHTWYDLRRDCVVGIRFAGSTPSAENALINRDHYAQCRKNTSMGMCFVPVKQPQRVNGNDVIRLRTTYSAGDVIAMTRTQLISDTLS